MSRKTERDASAMAKGAPKVPILSADYEYWTPKQYAELIGLTAATVRCMCLGGGIRDAVKFGGVWKIPVKKAARLM